MRKVFKYPLSRTHYAAKQSIITPKGAKLLNFGMDLFGTPCVWAEVDNDSDKGVIDVFLAFTGQEIPEGYTYFQTTNDQIYGVTVHLYVREDKTDV